MVIAESLTRTKQSWSTYQY